MDLDALGTGFVVRVGAGAGALYLICSKTDATGAGGACMQGCAENEPPVPHTLSTFLFFCKTNYIFYY